MGGETARTARRGRGSLALRAAAGALALAGGTVVVRALLARRARPGEEPVPPPAPDVVGGAPRATSAPDAPAPAGRTVREPEEPAAPRGSRWAVRTMVVLLLLAVGVAVSLPLALRTPRASTDPPAEAPSGAASPADPPGPESVAAVSPAGGSTGVAPDTSIRVRFSSAVTPGSPDPTLSPAVEGSWQLGGSTVLEFTPAASFVPMATYTVSVPGGPTGVRARDGRALAASVSTTFTVAPGSVLRLQQLLATLGYLPLGFDGAAPPPKDMALAQPGMFLWRGQDLPSELTSQWSATQFNALTRGAVMAFETQHGLGVDGVAGSGVWAALLADAAAGKQDGEPVTYVLVSKAVPQHLTVWVNGVLTFADVPCNTGVVGATTTDGTFAVFSHVRVSNMRGSDVTGSKYDVTVPWASYFYGGEALHGYPRAYYGYPQSNGCVEMPIATAGRVWPDTPIGTIVTVQ